MGCRGHGRAAVAEGGAPCGGRGSEPHRAPWAELRLGKGLCKGPEPAACPTVPGEAQRGGWYGGSGVSRREEGSDGRRDGGQAVPRSWGFVLSRPGTTGQWCELMGDPTGSSRLPVDSRQWRAEVEVGRPQRRLLPQSRPEDGAGPGRGWWMLDTTRKQSQETCWWCGCGVTEGRN